MKSIERDDLVYLAGVLDGRSTITLARHSSYRPRLLITCGALPMAVREFLSERINSHQVKDNPRAVARRRCSVHCPEPHVHYVFFKSAEWRCDGSTAAIMLYNVRPWMLSWDERLQGIWEAEMLYSHNWKKKSVERMRERGWEIP